MSASRLIRKTVLAGILMSVPDALPAQVFDMGVLTNTLSIPTRSKRLAAPPRSTVTPGESAIRELSGPLSGRPSAGAQNARLTYVPTPALRRQAVDGLIQRTRRVHPEAARVMAAQIRPPRL